LSFDTKYLPDVGSVTDYVNNNMTMLETETKAWQDMLTKSNLPQWLSRKLCNNISHFSTGAVYADDGRCSFNESPIIMNGCMGTIDQRIASHTPCTIAFPKLGKSDLSMFCETQITEESKERYAPHWNQMTGKFDARLDRVGAVKHNIGRDDFEGGSTDHTKWLTTHWPDRVPGFILELYMQAAWTGDRVFLADVYPRILKAIEFQQRLDQNDDGIGDVWGHGCSSFDSKRFQFHGASSYVATMWLAGLRCAQKIARILGDDERLPELQALNDHAKANLEEQLWNEELGQYDKWHDPLHANWDGTDRAHGERSEVRMTAQITGAVFVPMLDLEPFLDDDRLDTVLDGLYEHNVKPYTYCMANETVANESDNTFRNQESWPYYGELFYAAPSIIAGKVDEAMDMEERFANAMQNAGLHWDLPLKWDGDELGGPRWGRWYMSTPSSWSVLQALAGVFYDGLTHTLTVRPRAWSRIGELENVPVFHPLFWGRVSTTAHGWTLQIDRLRQGPVPLKELPVDNVVSLSWNGNAVDLSEVAYTERRSAAPTRLDLDLAIEQVGTLSATFSETENA
jgi:uncharacterized protein (DUF608 family)